MSGWGTLTVALGTAWVATRTSVKDIAKTVVKGMLTGGMLGGAPKMAVFFSGAQSPVRLPPQPMFQFHFDPNAGAASAPAPNDLAAMMATMGQSQSEMPEASTDMKPNRKHTVACHVRQLGPQTFRVAPEKPLPPGEYGFVAVPRDSGGAMERLWDFGVDAQSTSVR
jgi:hypothetical protein